MAHEALRMLIEIGKAKDTEARLRAAELFRGCESEPSDDGGVAEFTWKYVDRAESMSPGFAARILKIAGAADEKARFAAACGLTLADLAEYYFVQHGDFDALLKLEGFSGELGEALEAIAKRHGLDFSGVRAPATWLIAGTVAEELTVAKARIGRADSQP